MDICVYQYYVSLSTNKRLTTTGESSISPNCLVYGFRNPVNTFVSAARPLRPPASASWMLLIDTRGKDSECDLFKQQSRLYLSAAPYARGSNRDWGRDLGNKRRRADRVWTRGIGEIGHNGQTIVSIFYGRYGSCCCSSRWL
jgi:hypothetical protein